MKRVLLVDDDLIVLRIYQEGLKRLGFESETAVDGFAATKAIRASKPDVVVLDLMMPKLSGVEVLKFIRAQADLAGLPVIVLSNAFMTELARDAANVGVQKSLLKVRCSPALLAQAINEVLGGQEVAADPSTMVASPTNPPAPKPAPAPPAAQPGFLPQPTAAPAPSKAPDSNFKQRARQDFLDNSAATCSELRSHFQALTNATSEVERNLRFQNFYRKIHFVTATAGLAECALLAQAASVLEALLYEVMGRPERLSPSVLRTMAVAVDTLEFLFGKVRESTDVPSPGRAIVVDDDVLSNRLIVAALNQVGLDAASASDPLLGLKKLEAEQFDLVLLDVEMPGMNGFELCKRLRTMPQYRETPVVYVTAHSDFEHRAKSVLSGGDDLIAKPVFPIELAAKAVILLLKKRATKKSAA